MLRFAVWRSTSTYLEQPPPHPVTAERLTQFFTALPPWVRTTFDSYPPDEARRRLTLVYRLVFPYPDEFRPARAPASTTTGTSSKPATPSGAGSRPASAPPVPSPLPGKRDQTTKPAPPASSSPPLLTGVEFSHRTDIA